ncbi:DUF2797 domain-containing protein [Streptomyces sannanensis]
MRWSGGAPRLVWLGDRGERTSTLAYGQEPAFRAVGERHCLGVRRNPCPTRAVVPARVTRAQCEACARLDRARSVAADTMADDPRPYAVYLAWFGPGMLKVGITAVERGPARLLEQGAVAFTWLGRGPLMAARRTEELLRTALGVPDRIPYADKRAVRAVLPPEDVRAAEVEALYGRAVALEGWPESLERAGCGVVDHVEVFGLGQAPGATAVVTELRDGGAVAGRLVAAAGPDLHLRSPRGEVLIVDTRLMAGWELARAEAGAPTTVPVRVLAGPDVQEGLF